LRVFFFARYQSVTDPFVFFPVNHIIASQVPETQVAEDPATNPPPNQGTIPVEADPEVPLPLEITDARNPLEAETTPSTTLTSVRGVSQSFVMDTMTPEIPYLNFAIHSVT
jgi:hypothetical protein